MILSKETVFIVLLILFLPATEANSQKKDYFLGAGLSVNMGTKVNRIGLNFFAGGFINFFQVNTGFRAYYNLKTFGPSIKGFESQTYLALVFGYGKEKTRTDYFHTSVSNQTFYRNSIAFAYNYYFDQQKTSQPTGLISFEFDKFKIMHENDLFGHSGEDKYRTAAIKLVYTDSIFRFAINAEMWTGNSKHQPGVRNTDYPARAGYIDMSNADYGNFSNGILSFQVDYALPCNQTLRVETGVDSEKVRHILQNKIIHDWIFIPEKLLKPVSYNLHIPMLDTNSNQYLFRTVQEIEKAEFYINFSSNPGVFY